MTEKSLSAEAMKLAVRVRVTEPGRQGGVTPRMSVREMAVEIDALCEQRVSAAVRDFATAILHGDQKHRDWLAAAAVAFIAGKPIPPAERPAPKSSPDKAADPRECTCHPDDNPPRPCPQKHAYSECVRAATVVDYTERAREIIGPWIRPLGLDDIQIKWLTREIAAALSAVASEHQIEIAALKHEEKLEILEKLT